MPKRILLESQIKEWIESPVVDTLREVFRAELDEVYSQRAEAFIEGEPIRTQEIRAGLIGQEARLNDFIKLLSYDNSDGVIEMYLEENGVEIVKEKE